MQDLLAAVLESWKRQSGMVLSLADAIQPDQIDFKNGPDEMPIHEQLVHIHGVRLYWMKQSCPEYAEPLRSLYTVNGDDWVASRDLGEIRQRLAESGAQIGKAMEDLLPRGGELGAYDHPLIYMQHMVWHEGWHISSIIQALRVNGAELPEEWEEEHLWGVWRTEGRPIKPTPAPA